MANKTVVLTFGIFGCVLIFIIFIVNIIFSFAYSKYEFENNIIINEIMNSLNGALIKGFYLGIKCFSEDEMIYLGEWDGFVVDGCDCDDGNVFKEECKTKGMS